LIHFDNADKNVS